MKRHFTWFALAILLLALPVLAGAQDAPAGGGPLSYSTPAQGSITNDAFTQDWTLQTVSADRIRIVVERADGNLLPSVELLDASGTSIQNSYGPDRTGARASIEDVTLPAAGTFTVRVGRRDGETGVTSGSYSLTVLPLATGEDNPNNRVILGEVQDSVPLAGELTGAHWVQRYTYTAQGADVIRVNVKRVKGTLYPQVDVLDANDQSVSTGYTNYAGDQATIDNVTLPSAGTYTIAVSRQSGFNGYTEGQYELTITTLGFGPDNPAMSGAVGDVTYDTPVSGEIGARWYQDWSFNTTSGDTLTIEVVRTSGNLLPVVALLGGSDQQLISGYTEYEGDRAYIDHYQLQGPGAYTVRVGRQSDQSGVTTGGYSLKVILEGSGEESEALRGATGAVTVGTPAEGQITNARWADTWTFSATQGVVLDISVQRTSGTLIPRLEIRDANGQSVNSAYYGASQDSALISGYAMPSDGEYQIVVIRDGDQNGYTTGGYILTVKPTGS